VVRQRYPFNWTDLSVVSVFPLPIFADENGVAFMKAIPPTNFHQALEQVTDHWSPHIIGKVNDQYVKVAKLKGQLAWHKHDHEDEMFIVVYGRLVIQLEEKEAILNPGDFYVVPKNTMHNPMAEEECGIVLIETTTTLHTGNVQTSLTKSIREQLGG
jgi:mannose-6-phosphate isomerase-like protein (cupin superfamily)